MAASLVQTNSATLASGTTVSVTLGATPTPGNLLIAVTENSAGVQGTNPWGLASTDQGVGITANTGTARIYSKVAGAGESPTVSASFSTTGAIGLLLMEWAPSAGSTWDSTRVDQTAVGGDVGSLVVSQTTGTTPSTAAADELAIAVLTCNGSISAVSATNGFTLYGGTWDHGAVAYKALSTIQTVETTFAWTSSHKANARVLTYRQVAGAAPPTVHQGTFMPYFRPSTPATPPAEGYDVTPALQEAIDRQPDGVSAESPTVLDLGGARLHCETTLKLTSRSNLTIRNGTVYATAAGAYTTKDGIPLQQDGQGNWFWINPNTGSVVSAGNPQSYRKHWKIHGCTNVTLEDVHVESVNTGDQSDKPGYPKYLPDLCFEHAIEVDASVGTVIRDCTSLNTFGDGCQIGTDDSTDDTNTDTLVTGCTFQRTGRQGISVTIADNTTVENTSILRSARAGVDIEPETTSAAVHGVTLSNLTIDSGNDPIAAAGQGQITDVDIDGVTVLNVGAGPVVVARPDSTIRDSNWSIKNLDATADHQWSSDRFAFEVYNCDGVTIQGNHIFLQPDINHGGSHKMSEQGNCVLLANCTGGTVTDNEFQNGNEASGMDFSTSPDTVATGNTYPVVPV